MPLPDPTRREAEACAELASLPVRHAHAAGIDVGDSTHWVCVESTPTAPTPSASSPPTPLGCADSSSGCARAASPPSPSKPPACTATCCT